MSKTPAVLAVPFKQIFIPSEQIRSDEPKIAEIAASLKDKGLIYPVLVVEGGPEGYAYTLVEGFRRCKAWELNGWSNKEILVRIRDKADPVSRISDNWTANMEREDFHPLDQAEWVHRLVKGTYPVLDGEESQPLEREEVAKLLGISIAQVGRLYRLHQAIDADVSRLARKAQAPMYLLLEISRLEGEGEDAAERDADRAQKQEKLLTAWTRKQEALEASGRQRSERSDKGKGKGKKDDEVSGPVKPSRRIAHAAYVDEAEKPYTAGDYIRVLRAKQDVLSAEKAKESKEAAIRFKGILDGIRFMTGEIQKLPGLTKSDFDVLKAEEAAEEVETDAAE